MTKVTTLVLRIPTGTRSVHVRGRDPRVYLWVLIIIPGIAGALVLADSRLGFRLVMASVALFGVVLMLAMFAWAGAVRERTVRIEASVPLRFTAPLGVRLALPAVAVAGVVPGAVALLVDLSGMPTMNGTLLVERGPYVLAAVSLAGLAQQAWAALRIPAGLSVTDRGLKGVRGSKHFDIAWDEIATITPVGSHGPKLAITPIGHGPLIIDTHHIGSDPALVVEIVQFYLDNAGQRSALANGVDSVRLVERELERSRT